MKRLIFSTVLFILTTAFSNSLLAANIEVINNGDNGAGSLRQAVLDAIASGDSTNTITFNSSLSNDTITLASVINTGTAAIKITIDGSSLTDPVTISGNTATQIFATSGSASLELIGLLLSSGKGDFGGAGIRGQDGGAIQFTGSGDLTLRDCEAAFCQAGEGGTTASGGSGGVIYFASIGNLYIEDCVFGFSGAGPGGNDFGDTTGAGRGGNGGILHFDGGGLTILRSEFSLCTSGDGGHSNGTRSGGGGEGGAIACFGSADILISECTFGPTISSGDGGNTGTGNASGSGRGGAIFLEKTAVDATRFIIEDCYFTGCDTGIPGDSTSGTDGLGGNGGAIYVNGASGKIRRCLFSGNGVAPNAYEGGAIFVTDKGQATEVDVENSTFTMNQSGRIGGAIAVEGADSDVHVNHCTIVNNDAAYSGGGIAGTSDLVVMTVENCVVSLNTAGLGGADVNFETTNLATYNKLVTNFTIGAPMLSALQDVGAVQEAMVPMPGSPLIDGGTNSGTLPSTDIRLLPRKFGPAPDIGAVEITYQPDNRIGKRANPATHKINNFYTASGAGQQQAVKLKGKRFSKFWSSVENDGDDDNYSLRAAKVKRGYKSKSFVLTGGRANVTAQLKGTGYQMTGTTRGDLFLFEHRIKAKGKKKLRKFKWKLTASSKTNGVSPDVVRAKVKPPRP